MDTGNKRNRSTVGAKIQHNEVSEGRAALDDNLICSQLSYRPTPIPIPRRSGTLVTYPTFDEAETLAAGTLGDTAVGKCCSRINNQCVGEYYNIYFSDMARKDHGKIPGYRPLHIITRFGDRDTFSRLHLSTTELFTRHVGCHMGLHNHFLERVPAFGWGGLFSQPKTFQRKYFAQYSAFVCGTCEQISIQRPGLDYVCTRCDQRPQLLRCNGCKTCADGGTNNCPGFVLPSGDRFECGNFCRVVFITNKDHYKNCREYIICRWGPEAEQTCRCGNCVNCLDRQVNGPGNEFEDGDPEAGFWYHNQELVETEITEKDNSPEQTTLGGSNKKLSIRKTAPRGIETSRRKAAIDQMVRANKCVFLQTKEEKRVTYTKQFRDLCFYYGITNFRGHQACLKDWKYRDLYEKMPVMTAEKVLRQCFEVNEAHYVVKVVEPLNYSINDSVMFGVGSMLYYMEQISRWNGLNHDEEFRRIFEVLIMKDHKRLSLILMGPSNSGKSYFSNIITGYFPPYRVGQVNSPQGNRLTDFWLQEARGCDVKVMEELKLPNEQIAQLFKELFEGNQNLMANRKYRDSLPIQRTPVLITMNGERPEELVEWCSKEWDTFTNRCHIIMFRDSIKNVCGTITQKKVLNMAHDVIGHLAWIYEQRWVERENSRPELSEQIAKSMVNEYMGK